MAAVRADAMLGALEQQPEYVVLERVKRRTGILPVSIVSRSLPEKLETGKMPVLRLMPSLVAQTFGGRLALSELYQERLQELHVIALHILHRAAHPRKAFAKTKVVSWIIF